MELDLKGTFVETCVALFLYDRAMKIEIAATLVLRRNTDTEAHLLFHVSTLVTVISNV